jgi:hypothetical protein
MGNLIVAVMACRPRQASAERIAEQAGAVAITYDDTLDLWGNRVAALRHARDAALLPVDWCLVLQDDVRLARDFRARALAALSCESGLVSLYFGRRESMRQWWSEALADGWYRPRPGMSYPQWGQALAVRASHVQSLIGWGNRYRKHGPIADDTRVIKWARATAVPISYLVPSLVDHLQVPSTLNTKESLPGRRAVWFADDAPPLELASG